MEETTYNRIKREAPTIITAALVTLISTTLYEISKTKPINLASAEIWGTFFRIFVYVIMAAGMVIGGIWVIYKLTYDIKKTKKNK